MKVGVIREEEEKYDEVIIRFSREEALRGLLRWAGRATTSTPTAVVNDFYVSRGDTDVLHFPTYNNITAGGAFVGGIVFKRSPARRSPPQSAFQLRLFREKRLGVVS